MAPKIQIDGNLSICRMIGGSEDTIRIVEFLAFAKNGRPAVYWQRSLAEGYLADCAKRPATTGRVVRLKLSIE